MGHSIEELLVLSRTNADGAWRALLEQLIAKQEAVGLSGLTVAERTCHHATAAVGEILNGGFEQYLLNSTANEASEQLNALSAVGAVRERKLIAQALSVFPDLEMIQDESRRVSLVQSADVKTLEFWDKLTDTFFANFRDNDDFLGLIWNYVARHKDEFQIEGYVFVPPRQRRR